MTAHHIPRILIMAGGTGGHVFPALAVAKQLREQGVDLHWIGTSAGIEASVVPKNTITLHTIHIAGIRGKGIVTLFKGPFAVAKAILQARAIIKKLCPQVVLGMGGYASGPGGVAARLLGIPIIVHEQNAKPGSTNKLLAKVAQRILCGFPKALPNGEFVGNPVRAAFYQQRPPEQRLQNRDNTVFNLLVLGGSLGARTLNAQVPAALSLLDESTVHVVHQSGARTRAEAQEAYRAVAQHKSNISVELPEFIEDVASAMAAADLVICRSGALTVSELAAVGVASILVPFPHAIDDHQTANALWLSEHNAAILCPEHTLTAASLAQTIMQLMIDGKRRLAMATQAHARSQQGATQKVADICLEYMNV